MVSKAMTTSNGSDDALLDLLKLEKENFYIAHSRLPIEDRHRLWTLRARQLTSALASVSIPQSDTRNSEQLLSRHGISSIPQAPLLERRISVLAIPLREPSSGADFGLGSTVVATHQPHPKHLATLITHFSKTIERYGKLVDAFL